MFRPSICLGWRSCCYRATVATPPLLLLLPHTSSTQPNSTNSTRPTSTHPTQLTQRNARRQLNQEKGEKKRRREGNRYRKDGVRCSQLRDRRPGMRHGVGCLGLGATSKERTKKRERVQVRTGLAKTGSCSCLLLSVNYLWRAQMAA